MSSSIPTISLANLAIMLIPGLAVVWIAHKWSTDAGNTLYAISRMLFQLLTIGYFLEYIFKAESAWIVLLALTVMSCSAAWIALRTVKSSRRVLYSRALVSIVMGGGIVLSLVTQGVLSIEPWYLPSHMVPLAGMIFSSSLNSVSLAAERLEAEIILGKPYIRARGIAFRSSLIPVVNALFAVGVVSIPGLMTGQILSGASPLIAARYQIMVMCMVFGASGLSSAFFLTLMKSRLDEFERRKPEE